MYYPKSDESLNNIYYECYDKDDEQVGYYLDTDNNIFKPCSEKCKTCSLDSINHNNLCTLCNIDDNYHPKLIDVFSSNKLLNLYYLHHIHFLFLCIFLIVFLLLHYLMKVLIYKI